MYFFFFYVVAGLPFDVREKTDLKVLVVVIPKEGWARATASILLLVSHRLLKFESFDFIDHIL